MLGQLRRTALRPSSSALCNFAAHTKVVPLGEQVALLRIAKEFVPVVLARPMVVNIGLVTTTFAAAYHATARCMDNEDEVERTMRELLGTPAGADASAGSAAFCTPAVDALQQAQCRLSLTLCVKHASRAHARVTKN